MGMQLNPGLNRLHRSPGLSHGFIDKYMKQINPPETTVVILLHEHRKFLPLFCNCQENGTQGPHCCLPHDILRMLPKSRDNLKKWTSMNRKQVSTDDFLPITKSTESETRNNCDLCSYRSDNITYCLRQDEFLFWLCIRWSMK